MRKSIQFFLLIVVIVFSISFINNGNKSNDLVLEKYHEIKTVESITYDDISIINRLKTEYNNDDIVGTITINGTDIDTMLVQTSNNEYYLNHSYDRSVNSVGSIFVDYRNKLDDKKILIYGHNMGYDDKAFHQLTKYKDINFYKENKYIDIVINDKEERYEIFSVMIEKSERYLHTMLNFVDEESYTNHLNWLKEKSIYDTGIDVNNSDYIITLQTCYYDPVGSYFIINAKKI